MQTGERLLSGRQQALAREEETRGAEGGSSWPSGRASLGCCIYTVDCMTTQFIFIVLWL